MSTTASVLTLSLFSDSTPLRSDPVRSDDARARLASGLLPAYCRLLAVALAVLLLQLLLLLLVLAVPISHVTPKAH